MLNQVTTVKEKYVCYNQWSGLEQEMEDQAVPERLAIYRMFNSAIGRGKIPASFVGIASGVRRHLHTCHGTPAERLGGHFSGNFPTTYGCTNNAIIDHPMHA
ncbi:hypothetical protein Ppa06_58100 [Planomonospora parontospora subsp. parontospora]|uniref:Uncharacterized protein n=2 Tax=Planomonospora parontospora TaxID=58119 RepID=A0AA37F7J4_9ACTN|nr:hypothetical protein GCM10010126_57210 [Planomonospora parontospora]GII12012.1 hypothetical protein Ppa06_58100 [Planomonospora parontospora subsp. parontospora]